MLPVRWSRWQTSTSHTNAPAVGRGEPTAGWANGLLTEGTLSTHSEESMPAGCDGFISNRKTRHLENGKWRLR